jgi:hypothetical protein
MFDKKELLSILIASLIAGYVISFKAISWPSLLSSVGLALIILFVHHLGQKLSALFYDCSAEMKLWTAKQFWFARVRKFPFEFPMWFIFPFLLVLLSIGKIPWLALTTFEATPLPSRVRRRFTELTEWHLALISTGGLLFNAVLALISQILGFHMFAMLNLYFIMFNLIPLSKLDGSKIFFGSPALWIFAVVFTLMLILLLGAVSLITTIIAAVIIALAVLIVYYIHYE